ncbi:MAG: Plug domain-containing protein, partial [Ignavibacteriaceae bacterium]|nr:Plug domain-containing protein [Ignavibacteriaceae bacterium]
MKQIIIFILIFLIVPSLYAQDTLSIKVDSLSVGSDSLLIQKSDSSITDTTAADSISNISVVKVDTLTPLYQEPLSVNSTFILRDEILKTDYRYTENLFKLFPLSFLNDHGLLGYPDELYLYGVSNYGTSYFKDGIFDNNRLNWFMDLNSVQAENIDSVEIVPSPRAFLYGPYNRAAAVNFISKDEISIIPYTRVKYYQG